MLTEAFRNHQGSYRPQLHHEQLSRTRDRGDQRIRQAEIRVTVPEAVSGWCNQLRGSSEHAEQYRSCTFGYEIYLRQHHVRRAQHQE